MSFYDEPDYLERGLGVHSGALPTHAELVEWRKAGQRHAFQRALMELNRRDQLRADYVAGKHSGAAYSRWHIERQEQFRRRSR